MLTRRELLIGSGALVLGPGCARHVRTAGPAEVNDIHSQLNRTRVDAIVRPDSVDGIRHALRRARRKGSAVSIAGGRHAMGGQQFGAGTVLLDMTGLRRVLRFDPARGEIEIEAGIEWPELIDYLVGTQEGRPRQWGIVQKQTGADRLTIGGALAANAHGRGLRFKPLIQDVESFILVDAAGQAIPCDRRRNAELFRLAIGGYGLFGVIASVTLRLAPRRKVQRVVEMLDVDQVAPAFARRIADGFLYGDFQYSTETESERFLRTGVFSCYRPVADDTPIPPGQRELQFDDWRELLYLAHADKRRAFEAYTGHYLATDGQVYWSDTQQLGTYIDDYHREIDRRLGARDPATEMITEVYVPRPALADFLAEVREDFRRNQVEVIYGSIRLIDRDDESFLPWAKQPYACIIFNLHVVHTPAGLEHSAGAFRRLIDMATRRGGSYFLTYHRWATRAQLEACYPQFAQFLRLKRAYDPEERFQSDWYRHHRAMFADVLS
ncbi:MAG TPA: FAD-binding oxidoreductase [Methylomirabilota bacterium]|jgi:FAD/FMN-containing dehydrogenase|nr:FAD-binding oxidoreductase [Methylomirabilota bacterium]